MRGTDAQQWRAVPLGAVTLSVVLTTHNDAARLLPALAAFAVEVSALGEPWELILSDDGSSDGTAELARGLNWANLRVIGPSPVPRDGALRRGILASRGDFVLLAQLDNRVPIEELPRLIAGVRSGAHLALGLEPPERPATPAARALEALTRRLSGGLPPGGQDAGLRLLRGEVARTLARRQRLDGPDAALELLYLAAADGLRVQAVPVRQIPSAARPAALQETARLWRGLTRVRRAHARRAGPDAGLHIAVVSAWPGAPDEVGDYGLHLAHVLAGKAEVAHVTVLADHPDQATQAVADPPHLRRVWRADDPRSALHILRALRRARPDAVIFNLQTGSFGKRAGAQLGLLAPALARLGGWPTITLLHDLPPGSETGRLTLRAEAQLRALLGSSLLAVPLPGQVRLLRSRFGAANVFLAPHGTLQFPSPPAPLPLLPTVTALGDFGPGRRAEPLLEAHARLLDRQPQLRLVIAGRDAPGAEGYLAGVQAAFRQLPNVSFRPEMTAELLSGSTVVAFPEGHQEGAPALLRAAAAAGRALVAPTLSPLGELIEAEGYLAESFLPEDPDSLTDTLWRVLRDLRRTAALGEANWRVASGLPLSELADWYLLHLDSLLRRSGPVPDVAGAGA